MNKLKKNSYVQLAKHPSVDDEKANNNYNLNKIIKCKKRNKQIHEEYNRKKAKCATELLTVLEVTSNDSCPSDGNVFIISEGVRTRILWSEILSEGREDSELLDSDCSSEATDISWILRTKAELCGLDDGIICRKLLPVVELEFPSVPVAVTLCRAAVINEFELIINDEPEWMICMLPGG